MLFVHVIDMICGRDNEIFLIGEEEAVEIVDKLRCIGHLHFFAIVVEDVESEGSDECIAHRALLFEEIVAFCRSRAAWMPAAPFIDNERTLILAVETADKIPCLIDDVVHEGSLGKQMVELVVCEIKTAAAGTAIVVDGIAVHDTGGCIENAQEAFRPMPAVGVGAAGEKFQIWG